MSKKEYSAIGRFSKKEKAIKNDECDGWWTFGGCFNDPHATMNVCEQHILSGDWLAYRIERIAYREFVDVYYMWSGKTN